MYDRKYYEKNSMVLIEGEEQILQAIASGGKLRKVFHVESSTYENIFPLSDVTFHRVDYSSMKSLSRLKQVLPIAGLFHRPLNECLEKKNYDCTGLSIIADELQDHLNLGRLIKNAALSGCQRVFVLKGSANIWSPRTVRAAGASYFQIPVYNSFHPDHVKNYTRPGTKLYVADICREDGVGSTEYDKVDWMQDSALVIGNEFKGVSEYYRSIVEYGEAQNVHIPQFGQLSCLSAVTTATVMAFEALRQSKIKF